MPHWFANGKLACVISPCWIANVRECRVVLTLSHNIAFRHHLYNVTVLTYTVVIQHYVAHPYNPWHVKHDLL